jgi:hypothetical protein
MLKGALSKQNMGKENVKPHLFDKVLNAIPDLPYPLERFSSNSIHCPTAIETRS